MIKTCLVSVTLGCGGVSRENCTYFDSPAAFGGGQCAATICKINDGICSVTFLKPLGVCAGPITPLPTPFYDICPPPGLLPVLGPWVRYMTPTLDVALLISSRAGTDPGLESAISLCI